jgi:hypothetical protein
MKIPQDPEMVQTLGIFILQAMWWVMMIGVVIALVSIWALTEPFFELGKRIARSGKLNIKKLIGTQPKEII